MARGKKDSNKPKGRTTAYAYFLQSEREAMRAGNKENGKDVAQNIAELSRFCSEKWKCLDDAKKAPFYELAEADKRRYDQEMANYNPTEDEETPKKSRKRKRQDDENHPKRNKYVTSEEDFDYSHHFEAINVKYMSCKSMRI